LNKDIEILRVLGDLDEEKDIQTVLSEMPPVPHESQDILIEELVKFID
jgi:hypothetical protein